MSDETFPVTLAGQTWDLPRLPFRVCKKVQPRLLKRSRDLFGGRGEASEPGFAMALALRLDEPVLDDLADAAYFAVSAVDPKLTREAFLELPFTSGELVAAMKPLLQACGLEVGERAAAAQGPQEKK